MEFNFLLLLSEGLTFWSLCWFWCDWDSGSAGVMETELLMVPGTFELSEILGCMFQRFGWVWFLFFNRIANTNTEQSWVFSSRVISSTREMKEY